MPLFDEEINGTAATDEVLAASFLPVLLLFPTFPLYLYFVWYGECPKARFFLFVKIICFVILHFERIF